MADGVQHLVLNHYGKITLLTSVFGANLAVNKFGKFKHKVAVRVMTGLGLIIGGPIAYDMNYGPTANQKRKK